MTKRQIEAMDKRIEKTRKKLTQIGTMRTGSISKQYRDRERQRGVYYQLSYTHKMKSRTEHVWPEHREGLEKEITEYKKFKALTQELIDLSIERSKANIAYLRKHSTR
jgi:hypothetical protein